MGYSWADIALRLGITRQGAQQRWGDDRSLPVTEPGTPNHRGCPVTRSGSMLAFMPGTSTGPGMGANTGPRIPKRDHDYRPDCSCPACVFRSQLTDERAFARLHHAGYDAWLDHVWPAAACTRPVRLRGDIKHIDPATGELVRTIPTIGMPDGAIYKPCGNRRATVCPGCAETYRRDAYHLIRAGLAGGKGIPADVATHPAVFATFTAPSFGPVHTRPIRTHTCADRSRCRCQPQRCHARRDAITCEHGRPAACFKRHTRDDPALGQPLCPDCYDYPAHVVWNNQAGELWRRTKQAMERYLAQLARRRGIPFHRVPCGDGRYRWVAPYRIAHGKAAEYQARGAVHFHTLLRLDGYNPFDPGQLLPPPPGITAADLQDAAHHAAETISYQTGTHPDQPGGWTIGWGTQTDVRVITTTGGPHRPGRRQLPRQILHQRHRDHRPHLHPHHPRHPRPVRQPRKAPTPNGSSTPAGNSAATGTGGNCAAGPTCSASAASSSPKPAATPSASPTSARPASPTAATRTPDPNTAPSAPPTTPTTMTPPWSSAPWPTPPPAGKPPATPSSPTPPPTKPANAAKLDTTSSPTNMANYSPVTPLNLSTTTRDD